MLNVWKKRFFLIRIRDRMCVCCLRIIAPDWQIEFRWQLIIRVTCFTLSLSIEIFASICLFDFPQRIPIVQQVYSTFFCPRHSFNWYHWCISIEIQLDSWCFIVTHTSSSQSLLTNRNRMQKPLWHCDSYDVFNGKIHGKVHRNLLSCHSVFLITSANRSKLFRLGIGLCRRECFYW